jgi:NAD(P)-dependent dehydrogenase (short-subunit alcohol dehydrogenase family)
VNPVYLITGATSGIGRSATLALARTGADLILVGRNEAAARRLLRHLGRRPSGGGVEFIATDLSRRDDVRALTRQVRQRYEQLDLLVNDAGARIDTYHETPEGIELTFATNHLGHAQLTLSLADLLLRAPAARVITVGSVAHFGATTDGAWYLSRSVYDRRLAYAKSKLANVMFAYELARRLSGTRVTSNVIDPGFVLTNFGRNNGIVSWLRHVISHGARRELITAHTSAEALVYLARAPEVETVSGAYFRLRERLRSSPASYDLDQARGLWRLTLELTGLAADSRLHARLAA